MDIMKMGKNPNYLGSWDLEDMPDRELTLTISKIIDESVVNAGKNELCTVCYFSEPYKPMILNVTNKKTLCKLYKTKDTDKLAGKRITIYIEKVKAFGEIYDGLRIKKIIPKTKQEPNKMCEVCGRDILPLKNMSSAQVAVYSKSKYGKAICFECAKKIKEGLSNENNKDNN